MRLGPRVCVATVTVALLGVAATNVPADAGVGGCAVQRHAIVGVRHSRVIAASGTVVLYRVRGAGADTYWACRRGSGGRVLIGRDDRFQKGGSEYGATSTLSDIHLGGYWVTAIAETGADMFAVCTKYVSYPCPSPVDTLVVVDVRSGAHGSLTRVLADTSDATGSGTTTTWKRTLLSAKGGVAWLLSSASYTQASGSASPVSALYGCVTMGDGHGGIGCTPRLLGQGSIVAASLALTGTTLRWTSGAQRQSASLS
jgi:hypothetical protein